MKIVITLTTIPSRLSSNIDSGLKSCITSLVNQTFSDYESASSVERIEAFIKLGRKDPVSYANDFSPVSWETAKSHVEKVLANHESSRS